jgi:hypothetical protein
MFVLSGTLESDLVPERRLNTIRRENNRFVATDQVIGKALPTRFSERIRYEIPHVFRERGQKYNRRKMRQYGHTIPNVLTGRSKREMPATAKITATATRGSVRLRAPWAGKAKTKRDGGFAKQGMTEQQRMEFETLSRREVDRMAKAAERRFVSEISKPENRRKRRVRGG